MELELEKNEVMKTLRLPFPVQNIDYLYYSSSMIKNDAICTRETKFRIT